VRTICHRHSACRRVASRFPPEVTRTLVTSFSRPAVVSELPSARSRIARGRPLSPPSSGKGQPVFLPFFAPPTDRPRKHVRGGAALQPHKRAKGCRLCRRRRFYHRPRDSSSESLWKSQLFGLRRPHLSCPEPSPAPRTGVKVKVSANPLFSSLAFSGLTPTRRK